MLKSFARYLFLMVSCLIYSGTISAQESPVIQAQKIIQQKDLDIDGVLCFMECPTEFSYDFKQIDLNKDGFLNEDELTKYIQTKSTQKKEK